MNKGVILLLSCAAFMRLTQFALAQQTKSGSTLGFAAVQPPTAASNAVGSLTAFERTASGVTNSGLPAGTFNGSAANDQYALRAGDRISFQVLEDRELPKTLVVADSGEIEVPCLGRVMALGKTCKELTCDVRQQLEQDYYYHATVVIGVEVANRILGRVYIWGQVRNQGAIELLLNERLTAGQAILRAGGFADFANKKRVKLVRGAGNEKTSPPIELNMVEILERGHTARDVPLQPDDLLIIAARAINF